MKVVLFCGGYGMRMRNGDADDLPKPMQMVGPRPLLWHVMRYYAHFGHTEFVLCLGYGAHHIRNFFLDYRETESNDFVLGPLHEALRKVLFDGIVAGQVRDAIKPADLPLHLDQDVAAQLVSKADIDQLKLEAPLAVPLAV